MILASSDLEFKTHILMILASSDLEFPVLPPSAVWPPLRLQQLPHRVRIAVARSPGQGRALRLRKLRKAQSI